MRRDARLASLLSMLGGLSACGSGSPAESAVQVVVQGTVAGEAGPATSGTVALYTSAAGVTRAWADGAYLASLNVHPTRCEEVSVTVAGFDMDMMSIGQPGIVELGGCGEYTIDFAFLGVVVRGSVTVGGAPATGSVTLRVGSRVLGEGEISAGSYEIATAVDNRICSELELTVAAQIADTTGQDRVVLGACGEHLRNFAF